MFSCVFRLGEELRDVKDQLQQKRNEIKMCSNSVVVLSNRTTLLGVGWRAAASVCSPH